MSRLLAGRYALGDQIAVGGTSRVHQAVDERLQRRVAVKLLDAMLVQTADPSARRRFVREARSSAGFTHPHVISVFDAGEDEGDLYLVMELVDGPSLATLIAEHGPLAVDQAVGIALQVLDALAAAHTVGIVHRDVKPANVLLTSQGDAKLADFGIAKRFDDLSDSVTATGVVMGTPRYLAPEQALGEPPTPATDVYGVGMLLYEMLTGHPVFENGASPIDVVRLRRDRISADVSGVRPDVPPHVRAAVSTALAGAPRDRFTTATDMVSALRGERTQPATTPLPVLSDRTAVMPAQNTTGAPAVTAVMPVGSSRRRRAAWMVPTMLVGVVLGAVALAYAASNRTLDRDTAPPSSAASLSPGPSTSESTATEPSTVPSTTTVATTTTPPSPPTTLVPELVPGFPVTDDLEVFLTQLEDDPAVAGARGEDVANDLRKLLEENGRKKIADRAGELLEHLHDWEQRGEVDSTLALALVDLVRPLDDDDDGDDD